MSINEVSKVLVLSPRDQLIKYLPYLSSHSTRFIVATAQTFRNGTCIMCWKAISCGSSRPFCSKCYGLYYRSGGRMEIILNTIAFPVAYRQIPLTKNSSAVTAAKEHDF